MMALRVIHHLQSLRHYIGSHTCVVLLQAGYQVVILDNLSNSKREVAGAVGDIAGAGPVFYEGDLRDSAVLERVFSENDIFAVIHFAGMKAVGESVRQPLAYYENNVTGTIRLLETMTRHEVKNIVFSSSATVYGDRNPIPYVEGMPVSATSPYGYTKVMIEQILTDLHTACPDPVSYTHLERAFGAAKDVPAGGSGVSLGGDYGNDGNCAEGKRAHPSRGFLGQQHDSCPDPAGGSVWRGLCFGGSAADRDGPGCGSCRGSAN